MKEHVPLWWSELTRSRTIPPLERAKGFVNHLPPGDRALSYGLAGLVVVASVASVFALEHRFLISVPSYGGSLTEGEVGSPRFVNPLLAISDADRDLTALTYAGLMGVGPQGSLVPVLAQSYEVSPDGKVYIFTLRSKLKFSDGTPVTAADVVFTVEKAQDPSLKSPEYANWAGITAEAIDARTVRFTLPKPYAPFLENTTLGILPEHLWSSIPDEQFPFSNLAVLPVGAGPFTASVLTRDASGLIKSYRLTAFGGYALGRPYLDGITFFFFSQQDDLTAALLGGHVDSAYGVPAPTQVSQKLTAAYSRIFGIFFNSGQDNVFARIEVRKALSLAIGRENIVKNVLGGYATAIAGPVPPGSGIVETPVSDPSDRVAAGAAVLQAAGWKYDGNARLWKNASAAAKGGSASGGKLSLAPITIRTSNVPELKAVASAVKADWEKLGVSVSIELYEPGDLNQNVIRARKYGALFFGEVIGRDEDLYAFWDSAQRSDPGLNIALYANKNVDALLEDARRTADRQKRLADLQKIEDAIAADYPAAFIYAPDFIYVVPASLSGVVLPQVTTPADRFATVVHWYRHIDYIWPFLAK